MLVVGIDLSLASTGIAIIENIDGAMRVETATVESSGHRADLLAVRTNRITSLVDGIVTTVLQASGSLTTEVTPWGSEELAVRGYPKCDLVLIEAPSYGSTGASSWDRAGLWWMLVAQLHDLGVPVAWAAPTTRMKYATGSGKGQDKAAVAAAAARLFPDAAIHNSDEADALIFAHMASVHLSMIEGLARHTDCLKAVHWPEPREVPVG